LWREKAAWTWIAKFAQPTDEGRVQEQTFVSTSRFTLTGEASHVSRKALAADNWA
jgi:hypothetical protein